MSSDSPPKYLRIANELRSRITGNRYPVRSAMPTKAELMTEFRAAQNTIDSALRDLERDGLIETQQGKRTIVVSDSPIQPDSKPASITELERVEQALMELYGKLGFRYPHKTAEDGGTDEGPAAHEKHA
jgi:DNA-binding GntR family transcriptional regulator